MHSLWEKMRTGKMVNMTTLGLQKKSINPDKSYKYPFLSRQSIKYLGQSRSCQTEERQWRQHRTFSSVIVLRILGQDQWAPHSNIPHTNKWQNFLLFLALDINTCWKSCFDLISMLSSAMGRSTLKLHRGSFYGTTLWEGWFIFSNNFSNPPRDASYFKYCLKLWSPNDLIYIGFA